ncbi:MAG: molybdopterin molybdotransferase MoeA [Cyclobacteriaceae bacterium]
MINAQEAYQIVMQHSLQPKIIELPLSESQGHVLQESIYADRDFPPFDRVSMDGIAYQYEAALQQDRFLVEGTQMAGSPVMRLNANSACLEVMTGAMLPENTDTVTRYEDVEFFEENGRQYARLMVKPDKKGQSVHARGLDEKEGTELLKAGRLLGSAEIAVAASVGKHTIKVSLRPSIGIISTGDELVDIDQQPEPYQIRRSNTYALQAALLQMGIMADMYHLADDKLTIQAGMEEALIKHDALILSGGVSKGKKDYVPEVLESLGMEKLFHKVKQRPGKPFWFGKNLNDKVVFALPGNPVSTFMCFNRYFRPWLMRSMGAEDAAPAYARLAQDVNFPAPLTYFMQVKLKSETDGSLLAIPEEGQGSGDFANLLACDAFMMLPDDKSEFKAGEAYPVIVYRGDAG